ncbi:hypothetical protein PVAP13_3NG292082 [Panicum virgatum]|uniref:Uncharacterized protein n=1 Tax=Panicum virgatum TaxID=38727 RepID=A0A8T0UBD8_PANVG|nr:hypothetical protein PVAP13_3NG292082 [Panicum virgatum]
MVCYMVLLYGTQSPNSYSVPSFLLPRSRTSWFRADDFPSAPTSLPQPAPGGFTLAFLSTPLPHLPAVPSSPGVMPLRSSPTDTRSAICFMRPGAEGRVAAPVFSASVAAGSSPAGVAPSSSPGAALDSGPAGTAPFGVLRRRALSPLPHSGTEAWVRRT